MSRAGSSSLAGTNKRPRLVSHKSESPATADTPKKELESEAQQTPSAPELHAMGEIVDRAARAALARRACGISRSNGKRQHEIGRDWPNSLVQAAVDGRLKDRMVKVQKTLVANPRNQHAYDLAPAKPGLNHFCFER